MYNILILAKSVKLLPLTFVPVFGTKDIANGGNSFKKKATSKKMKSHLYNWLYFKNPYLHQMLQGILLLVLQSFHQVRHLPHGDRMSVTKTFFDECL